MHTLGFCLTGPFFQSYSKLSHQKHTLGNCCGRTFTCLSTNQEHQSTQVKYISKIDTSTTNQRIIKIHSCRRISYETRSRIEHSEIISRASSFGKQKPLKQKSCDIQSTVNHISRCKATEHPRSFELSLTNMIQLDSKISNFLQTALQCHVTMNVNDDNIKSNTVHMS